MARRGTGQSGPCQSRQDSLETGDPYGPAFFEASRRYGVSETYLRKLVTIESSGNPDARRGASVGLMQFQPAAAREMGLRIDRRYDDRLDPEKSIMGAARLAAQNQDSLKNALGRLPADHELYMAHQQGLRGTLALLKNPEQSAVQTLDTYYKNPEKAITGNGGGRSMTSSAFTALWERKYEAADPAGKSPSPDRSPDIAKAERILPPAEARSRGSSTERVARDVFGPSTLDSEFYSTAFNEASHHTDAHAAAIAKAPDPEEKAANERRGGLNVAFNSAQAPERGGFGERAETPPPLQRQESVFHRDIFTPPGNG